MANSCYVTGKAAARDIESLQKFLDMLKDEKFLYQEFNATEITQIDANRYTAEFTGCVKWSIGSSINSDKYGEPLNKTTKSGIELKIIPEECEVGEFWDGDITVCLDDAGIESAKERRLRLNVTKARLAVEFANKKLEKAVAELTTYRKNR